MVAYLRGPAGTDPSPVALRVCAARGLPLVQLDVEALLSLAPVDAATSVRSACCEAALREGVLYLDRADALLREPFGTAAQALREVCAEPGATVVLGGEQPWTAHHLLTGAAFRAIDVAAPDFSARVSIWHRALNGRTPVTRGWAEDLAARFALTPSRIRAAVASTDEAPEPGDGPFTVEALAAACRKQADFQLDGLAVLVEPRYGWDDLVLPAAKIAQLEEICAQLRHHRLVFETWGFGRAVRHGRGLSVLFAGPPGTGKTMAAEVVAATTGLALVKVDLSGVVSKYIGETEKNLARVFDEACRHNAILFFDEADALFGKRTEVSDAHDRYANIETSYLLQKLDSHDGLVLLASNLRANLDDAFTRRIRHIVEFPFPDAALRHRIWQTHLPTEAPVSADVDCAGLARDIVVAGGDIRNIVLNAAFLAAAEGSALGARHIVRGARREFEKLGKLWTEPAAEVRG
nr:ATP-binding protein [Nocardia bovistercoris]